MKLLKLLFFNLTSNYRSSSKKFLDFLIIYLLLIILFLLYSIFADELHAMENNEEEDEDIGFSSTSERSSSDDSLASESWKLSTARRMDENFEEVMDNYQTLAHYSNLGNNDPIFIRGNLEYTITSTEFLMYLISEGRLEDHGGTFDRMETIRDRATELLDEFNNSVASTSNNTNVTGSEDPNNNSEDVTGNASTTNVHTTRNSSDSHSSSGDSE